MADPIPPMAPPEELAVVFSGPAIFANKSYVSIGPGGVRLTFCEMNNSPTPGFRGAFQMSFQDALTLKDLMQSMLKPIEDQIKKELPVRSEAAQQAPSDNG